MEQNLTNSSIFNGLPIANYNFGNSPSRVTFNTIKIADQLVKVLSTVTSLPEIKDIAFNANNLYIRFEHPFDENGRGVELYIDEKRENIICLKTVYGSGDSNKTDKCSGFSSYLYENLKNSMEICKQRRAGVNIPFNPERVDIQNIVSLVEMGHEIYKELLETKQTA